MSPPKEKRAGESALKTERMGGYTSGTGAQASFTKAIEVFRRAMSEAGLIHTVEIYADGKLHRFKADGDHARNSWYVVHAGPRAAGAFGCWKRDIKETWCERRGNFSQAELQRIRQQIKEAESKGKKETAARHKKAAKIATWILSRAKPVESHPYLEVRQIHAAGELRQYRDALVLPLRDLNGELHSLQFIRVDGEKRFLTGGRVAGCFFTLADKSDGPLVLCEGYATGATIHEATDYAVICALNSGNLLEVAKAVRELWPQREIIIAGDDDQFTDGNPGLTKATAAANAIGAKLTIPVFISAATKPTDFNDLHQLQGLLAVNEQIERATVRRETDDEAIDRLAALSRMEFDRCVQAEAGALGINVSTLRKVVEQRRAGGGNGSAQLQGQAVELDDIEPWEHEVNGADVLSEVAEIVCNYVVLPDGAADAIALWIAHTHTFKSFLHTPRLNIQSPEKRCGKTTLRDVLATLVPKPLPTENLSTAVLFRVVDKYQPTLLADECDSWIHDNEDLRGLLNAGHKRGGQALRCVGDDFEPRAFNVFAPVVLAGIGSLPGTLHDRSIVIRLERAKAREIRERFDCRHTDRERELCRKLARWCFNNRAAFESCDPKVPDGAFNRLADNWRPLFAIAEIAGGDWPKRAREAFAKLTSSDDLDAQGIGTTLLADIAAVFKEKRADEIPSSELAEALAALEGRPWAEWGKHRKPISPNQLANQLRRFGVSPDSIRFGDKTLRGYKQFHFQEAFKRYLPESAVSECNSATTLGKTPDFEVQHADGMLHPENGLSQRECCGVAPCTEEDPDLDAINRKLALTAEADLRRAQPVVPPTDDDSDLVL
jgi:putative DNA primase/helicase